MPERTKPHKTAFPAPGAGSSGGQALAGDKGSQEAPIDSLMTLFVHELKDTYNAEQQLLTALPKMAAEASDPELGSALAEHLEQTRGQVIRLEKIFASLDVNPRGTRCAGMAGILEEGEALLDQEIPSSVRDAALIAGGQRVEHYEMAAYGTLRAYAEQLGLHDAADMLDMTLQEEGAADVRLSRLAERRINAEAMQGEG
jgi:ferritin-like metal-binding protein YciE